MERRYQKEHKYLEKVTAYDSDTTLKDFIRVLQAKLKQYSKEYLDYQEETKRKRIESEEQRDRDLYEKLKQKFNPS